MIQPQHNIQAKKEKKNCSIIWDEHKVYTIKLGLATVQSDGKSLKTAENSGALVFFLVPPSSVNEIIPLASTINFTVNVQAISDDAHLIFSI